MGCTASSDDGAALSEKLKTLDKTILAKYLSVEQQTAFAAYFTIENFTENRMVFGQNDGSADGLYIVADGAVNLEVYHNPNPAYKERPEDMEEEVKEKVVAQRLIVGNAKAGVLNSAKTLLTVRRVGEFFGARCLTGEPNNYMATTVGRTVCLKLTRARWEEFVAKNASLKDRISKCLCLGLEDALKTLQYFGMIDSPKLQLLAACFRFITIEKDSLLFKRDDLGKEGNGLHYMLEGEVKVQQLEEGEEKVVAIVKKLSFFGEVGLVIHLPRTSTVTARKKCLFLELSQADFRQFTIIAPEVLEAFRDRLEDYNIALRYLIHNPVLQNYLLKFMMEEKSAENLQFWIPAKDFRLSDNKDPDAIRSEANEIVDKHIKEGAELQVNINGTTRKEIMAGLKGQINRDLFQKAEEEVLALMTRDTWGRFKGKKLFRECLVKMTSSPNYKPADLAGAAAPKKPVIVDPGF